MKFNKYLIIKTFFVFISSQILFNVPKANSAEEIKIIYSIFSRTIEVNSIKNYANGDDSTKKLRQIFTAIKMTIHCFFFM